MVLVINTNPPLNRGVALDRNAAGKTGTLSKVVAVPDRANKMVNLVKVNVPNKEELLLLKKK